MCETRETHLLILGARFPSAKPFLSQETTPLCSLLKAQIQPLQAHTLL